MGLSIRWTMLLSALRRLKEGGRIGGTLLPPNIAAAAAASVSKFRDYDAGLKTRLLVVSQAFCLHRTMTGHVPSLPLTIQQ